MKAAVVESPGAVPACADFPEPEPGEGRAVVELVAAGIHPVVRGRVSGRHYSSRGTWPAVPGIDAVARTSDGRLVYTGMPQEPWGTMAERIAVPDRFAIPLPDGADPVAVAAAANPGMASWVPLVLRREERGDAGLGNVLVLGATGIAGALAVDNAFALGADRVVAVGRNAERLDQLRRGGERDVATVALRGDDDADRAALARAVDGRPPSVVVDFCWGHVAELAFDVLGSPELDVDGFDVQHVQIGTTAGDEATVPGALLRSRPYRLQGSGLGSTSLPRVMAELPRFLERVANGTIRPRATAYPLSQVDRAWSAADGTRAVVVPD